MNLMHTYSNHLNEFFARLNAGDRILSTACRSHLEAIASVEEYQHREQLQRKGQEVRYVWYLLNGVLRSRNFYEKKDHDVTTRLWFAGQWAGVFSQMFSAGRSDRVIEAISDCEVVRFSFADLLSMRTVFPEEWQWLAASMLEQHIRSCDNRQEQMFTLTARERYQQLLSDHPEVFAMIRQQDIASYLHISREELSRLRAMRG